MKTHSSVRVPVRLVPLDGPETIRTFNILTSTDVDYKTTPPTVRLHMDTDDFETKLQAWYEQQAHWNRTPFDVYVGDHLIAHA